jgi:hypothetical protein
MVPIELSSKWNTPEEILTIRLSNEGRTTVSFPQPAQLCGNSLEGFVMVYKKLLSPSVHQEIGRGCIVDRIGRTDVLAEAKEWKTLAPKDVYKFTVSLRGALLLSADGRYELTAKYYPPYLTSTELNLFGRKRNYSCSRNSQITAARGRTARKRHKAYSSS